MLHRFGRASKRYLSRSGLGVLKDEDVNLRDMDGVPLYVASLLASSGAVKDGPRVGGPGVAGSKPDARNFAIRGFSTGGGATLIWWFCGVAVGG